ncbi:hypothetical protein ACQKJ1_19810 [Methylorubrum rhodesianum]|uniref:hypothetical protein n=1 Tax=Methylorubrum rhodesianum TaxID=29427 RepID=UPI003CFD46D8
MTTANPAQAGLLRRFGGGRLPGSGRLRLVALVALSSVSIMAVIYILPELIADWRIRDTAVLMFEGRMSEGTCSVGLAVHICRATLDLETSSGTITRQVRYVFVGTPVGDYIVYVMADPSHLELMTTDLGLDQLRSRTATCLFLTLIAAGGLGGIVFERFRRRPTASARDM